VVDRRRGYLEPTILSVGATKAKFCLSRLPVILKTSPPVFELLQLILVKDRPPISMKLVRRKTAVILKPAVYEFGDAIVAGGPGECGNAIDESAEFIGGHSGTRRFQPCRIILFANEKLHSIRRSPGVPEPSTRAHSEGIAPAQRPRLRCR